jgi:hypothetical protein
MKWHLSRKSSTRPRRRVRPFRPFLEQLEKRAQSVFAQLVAAGVYEDKGQAKDCERVLEQARRDVQELKRSTSSRIALKACFWYYDFVGDERAAFETSRHGPEFQHVCMLYRRGEYARALQAANRAVVYEYGLSRIEGGFVLAELDNGPARARAAFQEAADRADEHCFSQLDAPLLLLLLGKKEDAIQASLRFRQKPAAIPYCYDDWYVKRLDYDCGLITKGALLQPAGRTRPKLCEAHFRIGLRHLAEGDRAGARKHFRNSTATRVFIYWDYMWARAFLKRLEDDRAWPPWIEPKK